MKSQTWLAREDSNQNYNFKIHNHKYMEDLQSYLDTYRKTLQCISIERLEFEMFSRSQLEVATPGVQRRTNF